MSVDIENPTLDRLDLMGGRKSSARRVTSVILLALQDEERLSTDRSSGLGLRNMLRSAELPSKRVCEQAKGYPR